MSRLLVWSRLIVSVTVGLLSPFSACAQSALRSDVIEVRTAQVEVRSQGSGDVVVVLSGVGAEVSYLDEFGGTLAASGLRVLAINPRGAGRSSGPMRGLTLHDYAADVAGVLDALGVDRATVLGFAGGNRVARTLAVDRPDLVDGIVLVAAGGLVPGDPDAVAMMEFWAAQDASPDQLLDAFRRSMLSPATPANRFDPPIVVPEAFDAQMAALQATPLEDWWSGGNAQMLVLQGEDDRIAPPGNGRALEEEFGPRVEVVDLPNAGHMLLVEQAARVAEELRRFVRRNRDR